MDSRGVTYAKNVVNGVEVAGQWVRLSCQKYLDDLSSGKYYLDTRRAKIVESFIKCLKHYTGGASGKPFLLEDWQVFIVENLFCLYSYKTGKRKYKTGHISVARKNGKTATAAAIALYAMLADGEDGAQVILAANSREQSKIDLEMCQAFAHQLDPNEKDLKIYRNEIRLAKNNSVLKNVSADSSKLDGLNVSLALVDELEESVNSKLYDVLKSSMGFREQPLMLSIGTAGFNKNGFCYEFEQYCKDVLLELKEDDTIFSCIYQLDEGDDWQDENNWKKASPNLDVTVKKEWLAEQVNQAKNSPTLAVSILTKNMQVWTNTRVLWLPEHSIKECMRKVDLSDFMNNEQYLCYVGIDLAAVSDLTAATFLLIDKVKELYYFKTFYFLPQSALEDKANSELYKMWAAKGYLILTDSATTDYDYILNQLIYWYEPLRFVKITYDSWNATQFSNEAIKAGLPMVAYSQSIGNFNRATKETERLILSGKYIIDNNPITRFCFDNVKLRVDSNGNCKPDKESNEQKIDGVIAMIQALGGYLDDIGYGDFQIVS